MRRTGKVVFVIVTRRKSTYLMTTAYCHFSSDIDGVSPEIMEIWPCSGFLCQDAAQRNTAWKAVQYKTMPQWNLHLVFTPWPFRPKGYCRCLHPSVRPSVCLQTLPCTHDNSQIWAGITKFAPNMHHGIQLVGIENRGHWIWPSMSFWPFWLRILGNSACPRDNIQ